MTSSVPNYDKPRAFIAQIDNPEGFMLDFMQNLLAVAEAAEAHYRKQIANVFQQIELIKKSSEQQDRLQHKIVCSVEKRLNEFCEQIPVIGWNSFGNFYSLETFIFVYQYIELFRYNIPLM